jgi:uncharacterized cupredoxin-like copper-binding protein
VKRRAIASCNAHPDSRRLAVKRTLILLTTAAVLATGAATLACGEEETDADKTSTALSGGAGTPAAGGAEAATVDVRLDDFRIALGASSAASGEITFNVTNNGPSEHEFIVLKTDLPAADLPMTDSTVDEEAEGIEPIDEIEEIADGETDTLTVDLAPGNYVVICNIEDHYRNGMHASFTAR